MKFQCWQSMFMKEWRVGIREVYNEWIVFRFSCEKKAKKACRKLNEVLEEYKENVD